MKYRFDICWRNKYMQEASRLLKSCDLDIEEIAFKETYIMTHNEDKPIPYLKDIIKKSFEEAELEILHIEGGKIE